MPRLSPIRKNVLTMTDGLSFRTEGDIVYITGICRVTDKEYTIKVPLSELLAYQAGGLAQDVFVSLNADQREFLISRTSPEGWKMLFG